MIGTLSNFVSVRVCLVAYISAKTFFLLVLFFKEAAVFWWPDFSSSSVTQMAGCSLQVEEKLDVQTDFFNLF